MNLFVLLWTQRWCKLCLFIPVRMTLFCKINNDKKKTTKKRKKRKKRKMKLSVMSWSFPEKYTGSSELELFFYFVWLPSLYTFFCFFFSVVSFCFADSFKINTALPPPSPPSILFYPPLHPSLPPPPHLPSSVCLFSSPLLPFLSLYSFSSPLFICATQMFCMWLSNNARLKSCL